MNAGGFRGRKPLKQQLRENAAAMRFYEAAAPEGKEIPEYGARITLDSEVTERAPAPKRRSASTDPADPLERDVVKAVLEYLHARPDLVFAGRFNRGQAVETNRFGQMRYTWFNTVKGFPDIHGLLKDPMRPIYLEAKRPSTKGRLTPEQRDFLFLARQAGAVAGVVTCVEDVQRLIDWT